MKGYIDELAKDVIKNVEGINTMFKSKIITHYGVRRMLLRSINKFISENTNSRENRLKTEITSELSTLEDMEKKEVLTEIIPIAALSRTELKKELEKIRVMFILTRIADHIKNYHPKSHLNIFNELLKEI